MNTSQRFVVDYLADLKHCIDSLPVPQVAVVADHLLNAYRQDRLVAVMGNGGSAATASHIACDLGKTIFNQAMDRRRFRVLSLADNPALLTAWANDVSYESIFAEQVRTWVSPGDVVIAISGSGNSANVCEGVRVARDLGAYTIGFLGFDGGQLSTLVDLPVCVASDNYGHIEDMHMMFGHLVTAYIRGVLTRELDTPTGNPAQSASLDSGGWGGNALAPVDAGVPQTNGAH